MLIFHNAQHEHAAQALRKSASLNVLSSCGCVHGVADPVQACTLACCSVVEVSVDTSIFGYVRRY